MLTTIVLLVDALEFLSMGAMFAVLPATSVVALGLPVSAWR